MGLRRLMQRYNNDINVMIEAIQSKKAIVKPCKECGDDFAFTPFNQLEFEMLGFQAPKRCQKCIDKRTIKNVLSKMSDDQLALFKSITNYVPD
jgi:hypothetical protein